MKNKIIIFICMVLVPFIFFPSCKKTDDTFTVSRHQTTAGAAVSDAAPLCGSIKGTMLTGKTYEISCDVIVNKGDTLLLQPGVTIKVDPNVAIIVKGTFISLGTQAQPNWISTFTGKTDNAGASPTTDPAYAGKWFGINCDTSCSLFVMKWTHVEFAGAVWSSVPVSGLATNTPSWAVFFQKINGSCIIEDSWFYGGSDVAVQISFGKIGIFRNTFEKNGQFGGESINAKSGAVGDIAYNLFVGAATNAAKISNSGASPVQCNINFYNNTLVNCGYRQATYAAHGAGINYEKQAKGKIYNNLMVNDRLGLRIVNTADTANTFYGYNFCYVDSQTNANNIYPVGDVTKPMPTDIPNINVLIPTLNTTYHLGGAYTAPSSILGANNPAFLNFPLPQSGYQKIAYTSGYDFHLTAASAAAGKGTTTAFSPLAVVPVDPTYGATEIPAPGTDAGCYQLNATGNHH
jgi:hypothetical protein